ARMRERPIAQLTEALRAFGVRVVHLEGNDCPPIQVAPPEKLDQLAPSIELPTTTSSQFISALMLIAPWLPHGLTLRLAGAITSKPYIQMTADLLARVGARVQTSESLHIIKIAPGADSLSTLDGTVGRGLPAFEIDVEPDASGATYFWAAAALRPGRTIRVDGLDRRSFQGDTRFPELLERMGADVRASDELHSEPNPWTEVTGPATLTPIDADLSDMPDTAMTLAACCVFAHGPSTLRGLGTLRVKETDRIAAMVNELTKLGLTVENPVPADSANHYDDPDAIRIIPPSGGLDCSPDAPPVHFDTYDDHRMAMAMALIALQRPNVYINDPKCVAKTYPTFWAEFARLF
ncbi:MAG: 3-phosphoshikimate 1-carboxyvinyltransferase, partial [Planctomycetota bacterium]